MKSKEKKTQFFTERCICHNIYQESNRIIMDELVFATVLSRVRNRDTNVSKSNWYSLS